MQRFAISEEPPAEELAKALERTLQRFDKDQDGVIAREEVPERQRDDFAWGADGRIDRDELERALRLRFKAGFHCRCCGSATFELYRGDVLVASLGFHHGRSVRWSEGWPADALLPADVAAWLVELVAAAGGDVR